MVERLERGVRAVQVGREVGIAGGRVDAIADRAERVGVADAEEVRQLVSGDLGRQHREVVLTI